MGARKIVVALAGLLTFVGVACGGGASKSGDVQVTIKDFAIRPNLGTVKAGPVTFDIKNIGPSQHEFVVVRTDFGPTQVPMTEEQGAPIVDEEGTGMKGIGEKEDINSGTTAALTLNLQPGHYLLICNLPS